MGNSLLNAKAKAFDNIEKLSVKDLSLYKLHEKLITCANNFYKEIKLAPMPDEKLANLLKESMFGGLTNESALAVQNFWKGTKTWALDLRNNKELSEAKLPALHELYRKIADKYDEKLARSSNHLDSKKVWKEVNEQWFQLGSKLKELEQYNALVRTSSVPQHPDTEHSEIDGEEIVAVINEGAEGVKVQEIDADALDKFQGPEVTVFNANSDSELDSVADSILYSPLNQSVDNEI